MNTGSFQTVGFNKLNINEYQQCAEKKMKRKLMTFGK